MSAPSPLEMVMDLACGGAVEVALHFTEPDDDWEPILIFSTADRKCGLVGIDPAFLANDGRKNALAHDLLPDILQTHEAVAAAYVSSAWASYNADEYPKPSDDPERKEILFVSAVTATETRFRSAEILRTDDGPPTLGDWNLHDGAEVFTGRFVTPMQKALVR